MEKPMRIGLTVARMHRLAILVIIVFLAGRMFNAGAQTLTNLYLFGDTDGAYPYAGLVQGTDGNFYGTTRNGGYTNIDNGGVGTVLRISPTGSLTNLHSFSGDDGAAPRATLVQGADGNFYGTTVAGGTNSCDCGTVFRISPSGSFTSLHSFIGTSDGANPYAGLMQGSDSNFYGTTRYGGPNGSGTVFRITPNGSFTNLYLFTGTSDGAFPFAGLVQGYDGNFYGSASYGGTSTNCQGGCGTVFRITPSGTLTTLHSFSGSDGYQPNELVQGVDGNFYGTTFQGGTNGLSGTVFKISPSGTLASLHSFDGGDGAGPSTPLVQGSDGNFYGTTPYGGRGGGAGVVFRISPSGTFTNLLSFVGDDGYVPYCGLIQGHDGNFYGTTSQGATDPPGFVDYYGTVFKLIISLNPPANQISEIQFFNVLDSTIVALPIPSVAGETYQLQYSDSMSPTNWLNTGGTITSIGGPLVLIDLAERLPPQRFYRAVITP